jgi:hypothetical protein
MHLRDCRFYQGTERVREFTDLTYSGPDCVCCKTKQQIIDIIKHERDTWTRQSSFNYRMALTQLIERIENEYSNTTTASI